MKILMIVSYYYPYPSGLSEYVKRISEKLVKQGHKITVLTSQHERHLKSHEFINGVEVIRCKPLLKISKGLLLPSFVARGCLLSKKHDVVNIHLPMFETGAFLLFIKNAIITYHCDLRLGNNPLDKFIEKAYYFSARVALNKVRQIITYTEDYATHSKLLKNYLAKCKYVFPPIDASDFKHVNPASFKEKYKLGNKRIIGFAGRIVYEKGINFLLDAIPLIKKQFNDIKVVLAGEYKEVAGGSVLGQLAEKIQENKNDILFLGNLSYKSLPEFYSACDVLVLPSIDPLEAFGIVQVESMLCGTPVVASDLPGVRQPIMLSGMGLITKKMNSADLARKVITVLKNREKYNKSWSKIANIFSIDKTVQFYEDLFRNFTKQA